MYFPMKCQQLFGQKHSVLLKKKIMLKNFEVNLNLLINTMAKRNNRKLIIYSKCKKKKRGRKSRKGGRKKQSRYWRRKKGNFFGSGESDPKVKELTQIVKNMNMKPSSQEQNESQKRVFKKRIPLLKIMKDLSAEDQIVLLHYLDSEACQNITYCIRKILNGNYLSQKSKTKLAKDLSLYKDILRNIAKTKKYKDIKNLLPHLGGGLSIILSNAIPILLDIARKKKWI